MVLPRLSGLFSVFYYQPILPPASPFLSLSSLVFCVLLVIIPPLPPSCACRCLCIRHRCSLSSPPQVNSIHSTHHTLLTRLQHDAPARDSCLSTLDSRHLLAFLVQLFPYLVSSNRSETRCLCCCYSCSHELRDILVMDSLRSVTILVVRARLLDSYAFLVLLEVDFVGSMLGRRTLSVCSLENIVLSGTIR